MEERRKEKSQFREKYFQEENKKLIILPIRIIAIFTAVAGLLALLFEIRYYTEFSLEIYFGRLIATTIAFIVLVATYFKFGQKHPFIFVHILLLSIIASFGSIILLIPNSLVLNSQVLALVIFTSALFLSWEIKHQIILSIYYNLVFATSILLNDRSIYILPNVFGSVLFVMFISIMGILASAINFKLRRDSIYKAFEAKLSEEKFRSIFENSVQGIFQSSKDGTLLTFNPSFLKILGYVDESEIKDLKIPNDFFKNIGDFDNLTKLLETHGKIKNFKTTFKAYDNREINIKMNAEIISDDDGHFLYYEGSIQDITRQVQAEQERNKAIKALQIAKIKAERNSQKAIEATKTKSQFLAKMNHELRTPMNSVVGYLTLIEGELFNDKSEMRDFARSAKISADSLVDIINNNLDLYKIESGAMELDNIEFDIHEEINKSISLIAPLAQKGLAISQSVDKSIPEKLLGDPVRYRQILVNLLGNAAKFTQEGEISVNVHVSSFNNSHVKVLTEVKDTGCGIPLEVLPNIFDSEKRIADKNSEQEGAGLGLLICKELVGMMGGEISAESEVGKGTLFSFTTEMNLTAEVIEENKLNGEAVPDEKKNGKAKKVTKYPSGFPKNGNSSKRILLVEDNESNQKVELKILREVGYNVDAVSSGSEALEAVKTHTFDLVLMDVEMKDMDGIETTCIIRELEGDVSNIPIIAVTAHSSMKDREKCLSGGMNDYIAKPINIQFLKMIIDEWLNQKR